jgi:hypothetical protein
MNARAHTHTHTLSLSRSHTHTHTHTNHTHTHTPCTHAHARPHTQAVVLLSGGVESTTLLHCMHKHASEHGGTLGTTRLYGLSGCGCGCGCGSECGCGCDQSHTHTHTHTRSLTLSHTHTWHRSCPILRLWTARGRTRTSSVSFRLHQSWGRVGINEETINK